MNNRHIYYLLIFFRNLSFFGPIITIFFQKHNLTYSEIMLLQSYYTFIVILFDIPSSIVSDRVGRKALINISLLCLVIGYSQYYFSDTFIEFVLSETILGLASSILSGVGPSYFYEQLNEKERENDKKYFSQLALIPLIAITIGHSLSGIIIDNYEVSTPFILTAFSSAIAFLFSIFIKSDKKNDIDKKTYKTLSMKYEEFYLNFLYSIKILIKNKPLLYVMVHSIAAVQILRINFFYTQFVLKDIGLHESYLGIYFAFTNLFGAFILNQTPKISSTMSFKNSIYVSTYIIMLLYFAIYMFDNIFIIISLLVLVNGVTLFRNPIIASFIQGEIENEYRATILSYFALSNSVFYMIFSFLFGFITDYYSVKSIYLIFVVIISLPLLFFSLNSLKAIYCEERK